MRVKRNVLDLTIMKVNHMYELVCVLKISEFIGRDGTCGFKRF